MVLETQVTEDEMLPIGSVVSYAVSMFYPYSGGSPAEHAESHRTITNRRWLVGGGLIGPYVATSAAFIASETAKNGGVPVESVWLALLGLEGLALVVFGINVTLNRT
jgi:hypothetical protein